MITVEQKEQIRRAFYLEGKSVRQIQRETGYHRQTIRKALQDGEIPRDALKEGRASPTRR
jgi:DNA invertase Pin-like site-specific DNA recombinase